MKWILAPDSFKHALPAAQAAAALAAGIRAAAPHHETVELPLADGGEGTAATLAAATGGALELMTVTGPAGRPVNAHYARLPDGLIVIELAQTSGIELVAPQEHDLLSATSAGAGELLRALLEAGERRFVLAIGGSATVDGGAGLFQALGGRCLDSDGLPLPAGLGGGRLGEVARIDRSGLHPALVAAEIRVACDVRNPLYGPHGAAHVFGPQKGATPEMVRQLDAGLAHWASRFEDPGFAPGDGAAGGVGFLLRQLGARMESGADLVMDLCDFDAVVRGADWLVTGEGRSDRQSFQGKLCATAARRAARLGVRTILCAGALSRHFMEEGGGELFSACFSIGDGGVTPEESMRRTAENLFRMGHNLAAIALSQEGNQ